MDFWETPYILRVSFVSIIVDFNDEFNYYLLWKMVKLIRLEFLVISIISVD